MTAMFRCGVVNFVLRKEERISMLATFATFKRKVRPH